MDSLNVPIPGSVSALAWDLRSVLTGFDRLRDDHTLVVKRLRAGGATGDPGPTERPVRPDIVREAIAGTPPFEIRLDGIGTFDEPTAGPGPVVYLAVESPELIRVHLRLATKFGAIPGLEGEDYTPHITLARGGSPDDLDRLLDQELPELVWTVQRLIFWDVRRNLQTGAISLPA